MLKLYVKASETLRQLRSDAKGVVSFEYIIVATCIVATVAAVFTATGNNSISGALSTGIAGIITAMTP
jgi:Flp pilus assembly pilin Flp